MELILDLLPAKGRLSDPAADETIERVMEAASGSAVRNDTGPGMTSDEQAQAARISQAAEKIAAGTQIRMTGELITLAQFGAGSAGRLTCLACRDDAAAARTEASFIAWFLAEIALRPDMHAALIPATGKNGVAEILRRAEDALRISGAVTHKGLRRYLRRRNAETRRLIGKIRKYGTGDPRAQLNRRDRLAVSIRLLLHRETGL